MRFKVLLVDDEPAALEGLQLWINWPELGFDVCGTGSNGAEGLEKIRELQPDLVVTDVRMPVMDGLEMIEAWQKQNGRPVSFAIVSGYSEFQYAQKALRFGITRYLLKPIDEEAASEELGAIYKELMEERGRQRMNRIASYEEAALLIKGLLHRTPKKAGDGRMIDGLSELREAWNIGLIQAEIGAYAEVRELAAAYAESHEAMYLVDLEAGGLGLVFGYAPGQEGQDGRSRIRELESRYRGYRAFMAIGEGHRPLQDIAESYRQAKLAAPHRFYVPGDTGILAYREVERRAFNYQYDQVKLVDNIVGAIQLLDKTGFEEAVTSAAANFREQYIAPEIVQKLSIHLAYTISEYLKEIPGGAEGILDKYHIRAIPGEVWTMRELMNHLRSFGLECIDLLLEDKLQHSQGIVQDINGYIREHFRESLTIKKLAEVFYLHPVYLGQLLQKKNGIHFNEMIHNLRIEEALKLLQNSKMNNGEVAERVGYANYGQFLKQFEKRIQMSPNEYRNRN
ncbi:response regulator [Paenibacillus macerans]|uniref:response regulator n=1 Tax=Paenibacillus macerans TaxID=44252 RepID=UPI003D30EFAE